MKPEFSQKLVGAYQKSLVKVNLDKERILSPNINCAICIFMGFFFFFLILGHQIPVILFDVLRACVVQSFGHRKEKRNSPQRNH